MLQLTKKKKNVKDMWWDQSAYFYNNPSFVWNYQTALIDSITMTEVSKAVCCVVTKREYNTVQNMWDMF